MLHVLGFFIALIGFAVTCASSFFAAVTWQSLPRDVTSSLPFDVNLDHYKFPGEPDYMATFRIANEGWDRQNQLNLLIIAIILVVVGLAVLGVGIWLLCL